MCDSGGDTETTILPFWRCQRYSVQRLELLNGVFKLDSALQNSSKNQPVTILPCSSQKFALNVNKHTLNLTIKASKRFDERLF